MIPMLGLPFNVLTKHTFSAKLTKRQGRRERGNDLSLPSLVSSFTAPEYEVYATTCYRTRRFHYRRVRTRS